MNIALNKIDNTSKSILSRACDPFMSQEAAKSIPLLIGNPAYVASTSDDDFIEKLKSRKWSVVFFAPGACRYNAAQKPIPGGNSKTQGWSLKEYRKMVKELQGDDIIIVETSDERETVNLLKEALSKGRSTRL